MSESSDDDEEEYLSEESEALDFISDSDGTNDSDFEDACEAFVRCCGCGNLEGCQNLLSQYNSKMDRDFLLKYCSNRQGGLCGLHFAAQNGRIEILRFLVETCEMDVNYFTEVSPLLHSCHFQLVRDVISFFHRKD
jgi:hypothetical protein